MATIDEVRAYWERHIHDLEITRHPVGSRGFFEDLDQYHFEKLHHLLRLVDFNGYRGKAVLEVGCGAAVDLARFAKGGAIVTGVDLTYSAIELAQAEFRAAGTARTNFAVADGEQLPLDDNPFDLVYAHGVVQYTANPQRLVDECRRVLEAGRPGDLSGLQPRLVAERAVEADESRPRARRRAGAAEVQHRRISPALVGVFATCGSCRSGFPVKSRLHGGWKGAVYNGVFVGTFNALPRAARAAVRLASAGLLPEMIDSHSRRHTRTATTSSTCGRAMSAAVALDALAREMCDRHTGIGADGLIVYDADPGRRVDAAVQCRRQPGRSLGQRRPRAWRAAAARR